jgi:hypothetical protein
MTFGKCLSTRLPDKISSPMMMTPNAMTASRRMEIAHGRR